MDAMYTLGLSIHSVTTVCYLLMIILNIVVLYKFEDDHRYKRVNAIFLAPFTFMILSFVLFTGVIMMAAKHLDFTIQNSAMVLLSVVIVYFEIKRAKALRFVQADDDDIEEMIFEEYKAVFLRTLFIEFFGVLFIALWMWLG